MLVRARPGSSHLGPSLLLGKLPLCAHDFLASRVAEAVWKAGNILSVKAGVYEVKLQAKTSWVRAVEQNVIPKSFMAKSNSNA